MRTTFTIELELSKARADAPTIMRALLKMALRTFGAKCLSCRLDPPVPMRVTKPSRAAPESNAGGIPSGRRP